MVRLEIRAGFSDWSIKYQEEDNEVYIVKYQNCYEIERIKIEGNTYYKNEYSGEAWRNEETNRKIGKNKYKIIKEKANKIIKEGNEYLEKICNTKIKPAELN